MEFLTRRDVLIIGGALTFLVVAVALMAAAGIEQERMEDAFRRKCSERGGIVLQHTEIIGKSKRYNDICARPDVIVPVD